LVGGLGVLWVGGGGGGGGVTFNSRFRLMCLITM
jgi:hypothetical protein